MNFDNYFLWRRVDPGFYDTYAIPKYLRRLLPTDKSAIVVDFGCGYGQLLRALVEEGYRNSVGIDVGKGAIDFCRANGLTVLDASDFDATNAVFEKADFVIASHVLEHIPKNEIVHTLEKIRAYLRPEGQLLVMVPNAQSNTGSYWAYEDFTHCTLFTAGSIYYVLRAAGFEKIEFVDIDCTLGRRWLVKLFRKFFMLFYKANKKFWNLVTSSSYHRPSEQIFSYEIKVIAKK